MGHPSQTLGLIGCDGNMGETCLHIWALSVAGSNTEVDHLGVQECFSLIRTLLHVLGAYLRCT